MLPNRPRSGQDRIIKNIICFSHFWAKMELSPGRRASDVHRLIAGVANPFARTATFWPRSTRDPFDYRPKRSRLSQKVLPNMKIISKQATFWPGSTRYPFDYGPKGNQLQKSAPPNLKLLPNRPLSGQDRPGTLLTIDSKGISCLINFLH